MDASFLDRVRLPARPRSDTIDVDGAHVRVCGHFPDLEAPERFAAELQTFLHEEIP